MTATEDFTEVEYRRLLRAAAERYAFEPFGTEAEVSHVLWRHDVDLSVHRARRLAEIEHQEGCRATYFFGLHSNFYNLLEGDVVTLAREICAAGHWAGLHLDAGFWNPTGVADIHEAALWERGVLERLLGVPVSAVSFHNPEFQGVLGIDVDELAGMTNAYGATIVRKYEYVSDSNGYWRFRSLRAVLDAAPPRVHVLTHPEWWQVETLPPRQRVVRCIAGRAAAAQYRYDDELARAGRENIG